MSTFSHLMIDKRDPVMSAVSLYIELALFSFIKLLKRHPLFFMFTWSQNIVFQTRTRGEERYHRLYKSIYITTELKAKILSIKIGQIKCFLFLNKITF